MTQSRDAAGMLSYPRRVGRADAGIRFVLGVGLIGLAAWLFGTVQIDWVLSLVHLLIVGAYLIGTAVAGVDPVYNALDYTTNREFRGTHRGRPLP